MLSVAHLAVVTIIVYSMSRVTETRTCNTGEYLSRQVIGNSNAQEVCVVCPVGTFGPHANHRNRDCAYCSMIRRHEVVLQECNSTRDTVIGCTAGFFRQNVRIGFRVYGECYRCTRCEYFDMFELTPCQPFRDTVCSTQPRPFTCTRGQYVSKNDANQSICLPCANGTFQPQDNHQDVSCATCSIAEAVKHEVALRACTATSDTIIGCFDGYFREPLHPPVAYKLYEDCTRCTNCSLSGKYERSPCTGHNDTLCCPLLGEVTTDPRCAPI